MMKISSYVCPSDVGQTSGLGHPCASNYVRNVGWHKEDYRGPWRWNIRQWFPVSSLTIGMISDGLSKTAAFSEKLLDSNFGNKSPNNMSWINSAMVNLDDTIGAPDGSPTQNGSVIYLLDQTCTSANGDESAADYGGGGRGDNGWLRNRYRANSFYTHGRPPNTPDCVSGFVTWFRDRRGHNNASSGHPGGVNVALFDGSVQFYGDSTDKWVWRAMGTKSRGD
jgi:prepilin-type processing-associated H-X9-DG protein